MADDKLRSMVLFFIENIRNVGAVRLQKALLLADWLHAARFGDTISGHAYVKATHGPIIDKAGKHVIDDMEYDGAINITTQGLPDNYEKACHTAYKAPDMTLFSEDEQKALADALVYVRDKPLDELSLITHNDAYTNTALQEPLDVRDNIFFVEVETSIEITDAMLAEYTQAVESYFDAQTL